MKEKSQPLSQETIESKEAKPPSKTSQLVQSTPHWQAEFKNSIRTIAELKDKASLSDASACGLAEVVDNFHFRIPHYYFSLIRDINDPNDPVRMQCFPDRQELCGSVGGDIDPLAEESMSHSSCLVHRYPDRVLLLVTGKCFMYCRHCTRKRLWQKGVTEPSLDAINGALRYVCDNAQIREVIISGGDPLILPTERLEYIISEIVKIKHIQAVRIGTRAPVVLPSRIDRQLCGILKKFRKLWINVQFNHPCEITKESTAACYKLQQCGIPLNNQSVLLRGVNDDPKIMTQLCQALQSIRVRPYYLFQCDPVVGAGHFRTSVLTGIAIIEKMRGHTSGMCVPTFVVDGIGGKGKIPLGPNYLLSQSSQEMSLRNYNNDVFIYHYPAV